MGLVRPKFLSLSFVKLSNHKMKGGTDLCDFITIASMGLGIASSMMEYQGAKSQYAAQQEFAKRNAINAANQAATQYSNLNIRAQEEDLARHQQKFQTGIEAAQAASTMEVAASQGGVAGLSVDQMLRDLYAQEGRNSAALDANHQISRRYLEGEKKAAQLSSQSQINSIPIPEKPSFAPYLIKAFGSGLDSLAGYQKRKAMGA